MFNFIFGLVKMALFAGLILILGSVIKWNGKTVSDQVKTGVSKAETVSWMDQTLDRTKKLLGPSWHVLQGTTAKNHASTSTRQDRTNSRSELADSHNHPTYSERQKLRALIQELNSNSDH